MIALLWIAAVGSGRPLVAQFTGPALTTVTQPRSPIVPTTAQAILHPSNQVIYLQVGDVVSVHLYGSADYAPTVSVTLDGTMQLPLIGVISVKGLTVDQTENLIASRLIALGMFINPQVTIDVTESMASSATITGEAHAVVPINGQRSLLSVLALAGGLPVTASRVVSVNRPGVAKPIIVDLGTDPLQSRQADIPIYPGDTIVTSKVGVVYLLGDFRAVGAIPIVQSSPLTLLEVASLGEGVRNTAKFKDLRIIRTTNGVRSMVRVDMMQVMRGRAPDPILQPDDIIYLPDSLLKTIINNGGIGLLVNAASIGIYSSAIL